MITSADRYPIPSGWVSAEFYEENKEMKIRKTKNRVLSVLSALAIAFTMLAGFPTVQAYAASGTVYTCAVNRCYAHPVTGVIEDSGGESSYATGQGMVEGCVYSNGILEVTDSGAYYLTIRLSLMDYTSGHSFQVQNVGDSGWSEPSEIGITGNGTDSNGTTADVCMRVPSENCIVRGSMYVEPMGRTVIFYLYPSDYSEGNNTDMNATMVTESSGSGDADSYDNQGQSEPVGNESLGEAEGSDDVETQSGEAEASADNGTKTDASNAAADNSLKSETTDKTTDTSSAESTEDSGKKLESTIKEAAKPASETESPDTDSSTLDSAEGLSLSTAEDAAADTAETGSTASSGNRVFQIALAVVVSGLILIGAAAGVVYYFRRNWRRWGGAEDDEE